MKRFGERSLSIDVKFDEGRQKWVVKKQLEVSGEFDNEEEAVGWSKEPLEDNSAGGIKTPEKTSPKENLPIEQPINPREEEEPVNEEPEGNLGEEEVEEIKAFIQNNFKRYAEDTKTPFKQSSSHFNAKRELEQIFAINRVAFKWDDSKSLKQNYESALKKVSNPSLKGNIEASIRRHSQLAGTLGKVEGSSEKRKVLALYQFGKSFGLKEQAILDGIYTQLSNEGYTTDKIEKLFQNFY